MDDSTVRQTAVRAPGQEPAPDWGYACLTRALDRLAAYPADRRRAVVAAGLDLGGVVAGGHLAYDLARDQLLSAAARLYDTGERPALRELERTVVDCLRRGRRTPKHPRPLQASGRPQVAEQVLAWETTARARAWRGRGGGTRLSLLLALYRTAGQVGRLTLRESLRELQVLAGHSSHSVTRSALQALEQASWVQQLERGSRRAAQGRSVWLLLPPPDLDSSSSLAACGLTLPAETSEHSTPASDWLDPAHDCWHQRPTAWRVALWLAEHPGSSVSATARALGLDRGTARRQLQWLVSVSLVACVDVGGRELRTYAVVAGAGLQAARAAESWPESPAQVRLRRHQQDREQWRGYLAARAEYLDWLQAAWGRSLAAAGDLTCDHESPQQSTGLPQRAGA